MTTLIAIMVGIAVLALIEAIIATIDALRNGG